MVMQEGWDLIYQLFKSFDAWHLWHLWHVIEDTKNLTPTFHQLTTKLSTYQMHCLLVAEKKWISIHMGNIIRFSVDGLQNLWFLTFTWMFRKYGNWSLKIPIVFSTFNWGLDNKSLKKHWPAGRGQPATFLYAETITSLLVNAESPNPYLVSLK